MPGKRWLRVAGLGLTSPDYGGQGLPQCVSAAVNEMWNASNMGFALCQLLTQGAIHALEVVGNEEQRQPIYRS